MIIYDCSAAGDFKKITRMFESIMVEEGIYPIVSNYLGQRSKALSGQQGGRRQMVERSKLFLSISSFLVIQFFSIFYF